MLNQLSHRCAVPHFDVIYDLLLNRRTATWNLFNKRNTNESLGEREMLWKYEQVVPTANSWREINSEIKSLLQRYSESLRSNLVDGRSCLRQLHSVVDRNFTSFHSTGNLTMSYLEAGPMWKLCLQLSQSNSCSRKLNTMEKIPDMLYKITNSPAYHSTASNLLRPKCVHLSLKRN